MPALRTRQGRLTPYALACGYVERSDTRQGYNVTLWHEHGTYHVRIHDHTEHRRVDWQTFKTLTAARQFFLRTTKS